MVGLLRTMTNAVRSSETASTNQSILLPEIQHMSPDQSSPEVYSVAFEKGKNEARRRGHSVTEQPLEDGSVKLTINVGR
jgi:hypothetical protein